jgi:valyl-tRNA synthetase
MQEICPASQWILKKYFHLLSQLDLHLEDFELAHSITELQKFLWNDYANTYIEYIKTDKTDIGFAKELFSQYIIRLSPYMPFETQAIWESMGPEKPLLANIKIDPNFGKTLNIHNAGDFEIVIDVINKLRSLRGLYNIDPAEKIEIFCESELLKKYQNYLLLVSKSKLIQQTKTNLFDIKINENITLNFDLKSKIISKDKQIQKTDKTIIDLNKQITRLQSKIQNPRFLENATSEIIQSSRNDLIQRKIDLQNQNEKLAILQSL